MFRFPEKLRVLNQGATNCVIVSGAGVENDENTERFVHPAS